MLVHTTSDRPQIIYTKPHEFAVGVDYEAHARIRMRAFSNGLDRALSRRPNTPYEDLVWALACAEKAMLIEKELDDADLFTI